MAGKIESLWFVAGVLVGILGTLVLGGAYLVDVTKKATDAKKSVPSIPIPATPPSR